MSLHTWWLFVMMTFVVSATPGPNMLIVMSSSARFGFGSAVATMAGCMAALLTMMSISAAGLGALLHAFPALFNTLRWLGAAYLAYLGIKSYRAPVHDAAAEATDATIGAASVAKPRHRALFRQGVLVAASNPKAILFAVAFLPQFIQPSLPRLPQFAILLATFALIEVSWYVVYAGSGRRLAAYLRRASVLKIFNRVTGGIFVGFAAVMAATRN
ncbi:MAG TPA: amino acid transporter [Oxalobacteraceae bacterium]|jgi:threonine/homoserine/homoserine lactone efflux protein|nr:amino acid transporter [Oxalobacteraceae bacterium]HCN89710.1 amino acid transporter [Oxalobacteraceae bacterium]